MADSKEINVIWNKLNPYLDDLDKIDRKIVKRYIKALIKIAELQHDYNLRLGIISSLEEFDKYLVDGVNSISLTDVKSCIEYAKAVPNEI